MDEALEDSQRFPIEKPKAKDSQFVSGKDKQPSTAIKAKDSQFVSAGEKDVEAAFKEKKLGEGLKKKLTEEVVYKYKDKRDPLADIIQVELTEGEWGYREENGKQTATRLPSAHYPDTSLGVNWDENDRSAITLLGKDAQDLEKAVKVALKYDREYKLEKLSRPIDGKAVRLWIFVEDQEFDEPYVGKSKIVDMHLFDDTPNTDIVEESISSEQKYPVQSPIAEELEAEEELIFEDVEPLSELLITTEGLGNFIPKAGLATEVWDQIIANDKIATLEFMLDDMYPNGVTTNELNKLLEEDGTWVLNMLGVTDNIDEEEAPVIINSDNEETTPIVNDFEDQ